MVRPLFPPPVPLRLTHRRRTHAPPRTASELKIKKIQENTNEPVGRVTAEPSLFGLGHDPATHSAPVNEAADRALNSVARKLDKSLSVEYTVNELIAEATDIVNLATIYHGTSISYKFSPYPRLD